VLGLRAAGRLLVAVGALAALVAVLGLLTRDAWLPGAGLLALTLPLAPAADAALRGPTDKAQRLRATLGVLTWFAGAGLAIFAPALGLPDLGTPGLAIALLSGCALALAGWSLLRPAANRAQRRQARDG
jgi:hypothetical protein